LLDGVDDHVSVGREVGDLLGKATKLHVEEGEIGGHLGMAQNWNGEARLAGGETIWRCFQRASRSGCGGG
jgi:hypothetical protein